MPLYVCLFPIQERELLGRISDLQEEVVRRKNHIAQLDHEIHTLNENINTLTKELELKGKEVLKIRSEANQQIRWAGGECMRGGQGCDPTTGHYGVTHRRVDTITGHLQ